MHTAEPVLDIQWLCFEKRGAGWYVDRGIECRWWIVKLKLMQERTR